MAQSPALRQFRRTLDAKPNAESIVKPGELIDVVEMSELTLNDRRIFNLLLANAWDALDQPIEHSIDKRALIGTEHKGAERIPESILRLKSAIMRIRVIDADGKCGTKYINLLGDTTDPDGANGQIRYRLSTDLIAITSQSDSFARLQRQVMFALSSKYSLALYEMIQKRGNMTRTSETFQVSDLRGYLGVPPTKLSSWINFRNKALDPAIKEVSLLSDFIVTYETLRSTERGKTKQIAAVRLNWARKDRSAIVDVQKELEGSKVGRKARLTGTVEQVDFARHIPLRPDTLERARGMFRGYDIYFLEAEWRSIFASMPPPEKPDGAFIGWCKKYVKEHPL